MVLDNGDNRAGGAIVLNFKAMTKKGPAEIETISLLSKEGEIQLFAYGEDNEDQDKYNAAFMLLKKLPKGKHTLKLKIVYKNQPQNVKDTVVKYTFKVK